MLTLYNRAMSGAHKANEADRPQQNVSRIPKNSPLSGGLFATLDRLVNMRKKICFVCMLITSNSSLLLAGSLIDKKSLPLLQAVCGNNVVADEPSKELSNKVFGCDCPSFTPGKGRFILSGLIQGEFTQAGSKEGLLFLYGCGTFKWNTWNVLVRKEGENWRVIFHNNEEGGYDCPLVFSGYDQTDLPVCVTSDMHHGNITQSIFSVTVGKDGFQEKQLIRSFESTDMGEGEYLEDYRKLDLNNDGIDDLQITYKVGEKENVENFLFNGSQFNAWKRG